MEKKFPLKDVTMEAAAGKAEALKLLAEAFIATHPDPAGLRKKWQEVTQEVRNREVPASSPAHWTQAVIRELDAYFEPS